MSGRVCCVCVCVVGSFTPMSRFTVAYRLKHMKAELEAQEKVRQDDRAAAVATAIAAGKPTPKSPKKTWGLPGNSTMFPIVAVPWS